MPTDGARLGRVISPRLSQVPAATSAPLHTSAPATGTQELRPSAILLGSCTGYLLHRVLLGDLDARQVMRHVGECETRDGRQLGRVEEMRQLAELRRLELHTESPQSVHSGALARDGDGTQSTLGCLGSKPVNGNALRVARGQSWARACPRCARATRPAVGVNSTHTWAVC